MTIDIFTHTNRPAASLFYRRDDPNDPRLGEVVRSDSGAYVAADVVILGCPQDEGVRRNKGRVGAKAAPDAIRACFYRMGLARLDETLQIFDLGNSIIQGTLEATHELQQQIVEQIIRDGKLLISLGGGNDLSYPDCVGLARAVADLLAFNVDAHYDVRADEPRNSGTPYRQLLEEGYIKAENFYEIAGQPLGNSPIYERYLLEKGAQIVHLTELRARGVTDWVASILKQHDTDAIFWGFDLDAVRAADAPGVSAPNPLGLTGDEFCALAELAGREPRTRLLEFTEMNPIYDIDERTCRLTAAAMFFFLLGLSARRMI